MTRICTQCSVEKPLTDEFFYKNQDNKYGYLAACKGCVAAKSTQYRKNHPEVLKARDARRKADPVAYAKKLAMTQDWRTRNPEKAKASCWDSTLRRKYKKTPEQFAAQRIAQNNGCAICRTPFTKTPHNDHDHLTGENRGLLCDSCNLGLGHFKDSVPILQQAIDYLRTYGPHSCNLGIPQ